MESTPKITVVTVTYNAAKVLEKTILSVINQTYPNIEYIIIDGASTDGTMDVVNKYRDRISTVVSEPDKGIYDAMNKGIKLATGDWINFMNSGDRFVDENVVKKIFTYVATEVDNNIGIIQGNIIYDYGENGLVYRPYKKNLSNYMDERLFCHQAIFIKEFLTKTYPFDIRYKIGADADQVNKIINRGYSVKYINEYIAFYDTKGVSSTNLLQLYKERFLIDGKKKNLKYVFMCIKLKIKITFGFIFNSDWYKRRIIAKQKKLYSSI